MKAYAIAAALAAGVIGVAPAAVADPTYGAFVEGGIANNGDGSPNTQGIQCGGVCYYDGTSYVTGAGQYASASGAVGTPGSWGYSSGDADLASGLLSVSASSNGNPPYQDNPPPFGSPAGATAGFYTEIEFNGPGAGGVVSLTMSGTTSNSGNTALTYGLDLNTCCIFGGGSVIDVSNGKWSETQSFTVQYGVEYLLSAYISVATSGQFLPGSASVTDPFSIGLPQGVTYTAADRGFLQSATGVPEPGTFALFGAALLALGGLGLRRKAI